MDWVLVLLVARISFSGDPWIEQRVGFMAKADCEGALVGMRLQPDASLVAFCAPSTGVDLYAPGCRPCPATAPCPDLAAPSADLNRDGAVGPLDFALFQRLYSEAQSTP